MLNTNMVRVTLMACIDYCFRQVGMGASVLMREQVTFGI